MAVSWGITGDIEEVSKSPGELSLEWRINEFLYLVKAGILHYESPHFFTFSNKWRMRLYVKTPEDKSGFLSLSVLQFNPDNSKIVNIAVGLRGPNGVIKREEPIRKLASENGWFLGHFCWISELQDQSSRLILDKAFTITCKIKLPGTDRSALLNPFASIQTDDKFRQLNTNAGKVSQSLDEEGVSNLRLLAAGFDGLSVQPPQSVDPARALSKCSIKDSFPLFSNLKEEAGAPLDPYASIQADDELRQLNTNACNRYQSLNEEAMKDLQNCLQNLMKSKEDCDVIITVQGKEFRAHRLILQARSPVFQAMFTHDMVEKQKGIVTLEDCDPETFPEFLEHIYTGNIEMISTVNVFSLFTASDKYDFSTLKKSCVEFIKKNLTIASFCDAITLATMCNEKELIEHATEFFCKNALDIVKTVEWQTFLKENTTVGNELLIKLLSK